MCVYFLSHQRTSAFGPIKLKSLHFNVLQLDKYEGPDSLESFIGYAVSMRTEISYDMNTSDDVSAVSAA